MTRYSFGLACLLYLFLVIDTFGQQLPLFTQYIFDPYLVNPSMLATSRKSEINLLYRQQWTGIQDGPQTIQADFQHAFNNRVLFGLNVFDDKTILLSSTTVMATFGYRIPLAEDHILSFGLSGGFISNRIKTEDVPTVDINDPALLSSSANNFSLDGQFGISYNYRNLVIGFSLVRLVDNTTFSEETFQMPEFNELKNNVILAGYKFNLSNEFSFQPNFSYRFTADNLDFFEASGIFSYKDIMSVGGGYREGYGPTAVARVNIKDLQVGYAYDFPSAKADVSTGGTNEVQLKWRFGKTLEKLTKRQKSSDENATELAQQAKNTTEDKEVPVLLTEPIKEENKEKPNPVTIEEMAKPLDEKKIDDVIPQPTEASEFILIAGTFTRKSNAEKLVKELANQGFDGEIKHDERDDYFYVHIPKYKTDKVTIDKILEIRTLEIFKDAWYKRIEK